MVALQRCRRRESPTATSPIGDDRNGNTPAPNRSTRPNPRALSGSIGPQILNIFEKIYQDFCEAATLEDRIEELKNDVMDTQRLQDQLECQELHLTDDLWLDSTDYVEIGKAQIAILESERAEAAVELETVKARLTALTTQREIHWKDFCNHAYEYFNSCLAADFSAPGA